MAPRCTCGAYPPEDARFCHKCGRPLYEMPALEEDEPEPVPVAEPVTATRTDAPNAMQGHLLNGPAMRAAAIAAFLSMVPFFIPIPLLQGIAPFVSAWMVGMLAVWFYRRHTQSTVSLADGARLGRMAGLFAFLLLALQLLLIVVALQYVGGLEAELGRALQDLGISRAEFEQVRDGLHSPMVIGPVMLLFLAIFTLLPMLAGAVTAALQKRDS